MLRQGVGGNLDSCRINARRHPGAQEGLKVGGFRGRATTGQRSVGGRGPAGTFEDGVQEVDHAGLTVRPGDSDQVEVTRGPSLSRRH